jgi:hypothetical protein
MPRPDLQLLPVNYRRIPILAIGRDVYLDTRLILRKLEAHSFPNSVAALLGAATPQDVFVEKLLERYMVEGPLFSMTAGCIPSAKASDPTFKKDRQGFLGKSWEKKEMDEGRGECVNYVRGVYQLFEETVLADGRKWVLGGEGPKLADIEGEYKDFFDHDFQSECCDFDPIVVRWIFEVCRTASRWMSFELVFVIDGCRICDFSAALCREGS